jgi:hypothetical protein
MKRLLIYLLVLFFCLIINVLLTSCDKFLLRITGNYKTPKEQDSLSVLNFVKHSQACYDQLFVFKSKFDYQSFFREHPELPGNLIFDSEKRLLHPSNGTTCPWAAYYSLIDSSSIIRSIEFLPDSIISERESLGYVLNRLKPVEIKVNDEPYDYYLITVWAKFTPKFTKETFKELYRFKSAPNKRICVILVDADIQKEW